MHIRLRCIDCEHWHICRIEEDKASICNHHIKKTTLRAFKDLRLAYDDFIEIIIKEFRKIF
jgi:hypothetical protein